jgi:hypothetical protein
VLGASAVCNLRFPDDRYGGNREEMTVCKETVFLNGVLRGEGRERTCRVRATRNSEFPDESVIAASIAYCRCCVEDVDDFPDGDYELEFDGHKVSLSRKDGQYLARVQSN